MMSLPSLLAVTILLQGLDPGGLRHTQPLRDYLTLSVTADRTTYYTGELMRLQITAKNTGQVPVTAFLLLNPSFAESQASYRQGNAAFQDLGFLRWKQFSYMGRRRTLQPGQEYSVDSELSVTAYEAGARAFLLDRPGRYEFRVHYSDTPLDPNGVLDSNILAVDVVDSPAEEATARAAYTPDLAYVAQFQKGRSYLSPAVTEAAADFIERFPDSRYVLPVRDGLRRSLSYRVRTGSATDEERALYDRLFSDTTAPVLSVSASPSSLWPPNHKLTRINVTVSVSDDTDPNPAVKLVSITCDDDGKINLKPHPKLKACDPGDVNAAFGTDDRDLALRAERLGSGPGRVYEITYSAEDAAGNKAVATTTVTVTHDQGKKK